MPVQQGQYKSAEQPHEHILQSIKQAKHHVCTQEIIQYILVKFPKDNGCPCAGKCEDDLYQQWNIPDHLL